MTGRIIACLECGWRFFLPSNRKGRRCDTCAAVLTHRMTPAAARAALADDRPRVLCCDWQVFGDRERGWL